jgi:hypothetical protein
MKLNGSLAPGYPRLSGLEALPATASTGRGLSPSATTVTAVGPQADAVLDLLAPVDRRAGVASLGMLLARVGRLLGALRDSGGSVFVAAFELSDPPEPGRDRGRAVAAVIEALHGELRFDDPVGRLDDSLFVVAAPLAPGAGDGAGMADHLAASIARAVESAIGRSEAGVAVGRAQVVAAAPFPEEADALVRQVVAEVRAG